MIGSQQPTSSAAPLKVRIQRAAFSKLYFWVDMHRERVSPRKFEKFHNWAKPSPRFNPVIMHQTITGILRKIREIEALSMGVETLRGYNLCRPPDCNPKTRDHKQASIFVEFADAFSCHTRVCTVFLATRKSWTSELLAFDEKSTFDFFALFRHI